MCTSQSPPNSRGSLSVSKSCAAQEVGQPLPGPVREQRTTPSCKLQLTSRMWATGRLEWKVILEVVSGSRKPAYSTKKKTSQWVGFRI